MSTRAYEPSKWQREFHLLSVFEALGGWAPGPGKSTCLLMDPLEQIVLQHARCLKGEFRMGEAPGWALHLRKEFPMLAETIHRAKRLFPAIDPEVRWHDAESTFRFSSGYGFTFGHLAKEDSHLRYGARRYTHLGIDELGELPSRVPYDFLVGRVRCPEDPVLAEMLKVRCMSNRIPGWVEDYFVKPAPKGRTIIEKRVEMPDGRVETLTRLFLPASLDDNPDAEFRAAYKAALQRAGMERLL